MYLFNVLIILSILILTGCPSSKSGVVYTRDQAKQVQQVELGTVQSARTVLIEGTGSVVGSGAGTIIGAIAGSNVGQGKGSAIATIIGGIAGGLLGAAAEEGVTRQEGLEITVQLDSGQILSIVQGADIAFQAGERVRVLTNGSDTRVAR